jgi:uncharacterized SAM-binding protein YcdF (DUF218 family)
VNEILFSLGIESWKPWLTLLVMPPLPFIVLVLAGARLMFRRRLAAWLLVLLGCAGLWLMCTVGLAKLMLNGLLKPPPVLGSSEIAELKRQPHTAIVVLGGGRRLLAPEYGVATLKPRSIERLRYGLWLARETGLPVAFSGGVGLGAEPGPTEADIAARIAERDFGRALHWLENESRDTRENSLRTVALLRPQGIEQIVLVTHADHMPRALRHFRRDAEAGTPKLRIVAAPMGGPAHGNYVATDWLPSATGFEMTSATLHEWLGWLAGA